MQSQFPPCSTWGRPAWPSSSCACSFWGWCSSSSSSSWPLLSGGGPDGGWTPSGCCSQRGCGHPQAVYRQRSASVDQGEFLLKRHENCQMWTVTRQFNINIFYSIAIETLFKCKLGVLKIYLLCPESWLWHSR